MSIVVSDTSPIRALHHIGELRLLHEFYQECFIPPAVAAELLAPPGSFVSVDVRSIPFIVVRAPADANSVQDLRRTLDVGEAEAIALAIELPSATLLIDELAGRAAAASLGIPHIGVLGVLAQAKREGHISSVRPLVDRLRSELRFRVSHRLYEEYLRSMSEYE